VVTGLLAGCSRISGDSLEARHAAERYLAAVSRQDLTTAHHLASCRIPDSAFRGANLISNAIVDSLTKARLDSLASDVGEVSARAAIDLARADETTAESLWTTADAASRRARVLADARSGAAMSERTARTQSDDRPIVTMCRLNIRVRWGGPRVGPEPVDREHVLRLVRSGQGPWIVVSMLTRDLDPGPFLLSPVAPITRSRSELTAAAR